ncbi:hypothetical protein [Labilibaculum filiforme]|uniref:TraG/VirB4 family ATPase n=1 Tax=Labilibaculum filiforme TaxID=1940526 RepID=UPI003CCB9A99
MFFPLLIIRFVIYNNRPSLRGHFKKHLIHNKNKLIIGGSGSGKSFFFNLHLR